MVLRKSRIGWCAVDARAQTLSRWESLRSRSVTASNRRCRVAMPHSTARQFRLHVLLLAATSALAAGAPIAQVQAQQSVADFYAGKQVRFIIRSAPGGGFDLYSRLLGAYIVRHIPGHPIVLFQNMPGGGGLQAVNYMDEIAPKDGTYL